MKCSGIYRITHQPSGKVYIGQSRCVINRLSSHKSRLRSNRHKNPYLQAAFNKYGEQSFTWELQEAVCLERLSERESYWIGHYDSYNRQHGYNITYVDPTGVVINAPNTGKKASQETKQRMSEVRLGKPKSEQHRAAIRQANSKKVWHFVNQISGDVIEEGNIQNIAKTRGLSASALHRVSTGKLQQYRGWVKPPTITGEN